DLVRPARAERRRDGAGGGKRQSAFGLRAKADRVYVAEVFALRRSYGQRQPPLFPRRFRGSPRGARREERLGVGSVGAVAARRNAQRKIAGRMETARGVRRGDYARTERAVP